MNEQDKAQILEKLSSLEDKIDAISDLVLEYGLQNVIQTRALRNNLKILHGVLRNKKEAEEAEEASLEAAAKYIENIFANNENKSLNEE